MSLEQTGQSQRAWQEVSLSLRDLLNGEEDQDMDCQIVSPPPRLPVTTVTLFDSDSDEGNSDPGAERDDDDEEIDVRDIPLPPNTPPQLPNVQLMDVNLHEEHSHHLALDVANRESRDLLKSDNDRSHSVEPSSAKVSVRHDSVQEKSLRCSQHVPDPDGLGTSSSIHRISQHVSNSSSGLFSHPDDVKVS